MPGEADVMVLQWPRSGDYLPLEDHLSQMESRAQEFAHYDDDNLLQEADEASRSADRHAVGIMDLDPRDDDDGDGERFLRPVPRLPRARPGSFRSRAGFGGERFLRPVPRLPRGRPGTFRSRAGIGYGAYGARGGGDFVPAAAPAAAVKNLVKLKYGGPRDGTSADTTGCVICIQDYEVGDELSVVPCSGRHRFHERCLAVWVARKRLCPLCRHALPAEESITYGLN